MNDVVVHQTPQTLATAVATALLERLAAAQGRGEVPQIALTGGTIADALHREVARLSPGSGVDWSRVVVWWGDERFVDAASPDRNAGQARQAFLDDVGIPSEQVHEVPSSSQASSAEEAALAYAQDLREHGSGAFEVLMLGIGPDGHIASLFPGHPGLDATDAIAVAVHDSPKPPPDRVSLTFEALNRAVAVWFVASGEGKSEAVAAALAGGDRHEIPARGVHGTAETVWHLDRESARLLDI